VGAGGATVAVILYAAATAIHPIPYRDDNRVRLRIVVEQAFHTFIVLLTGAWPSPFALCLVPTACSPASRPAPRSPHSSPAAR